MPVVLHINRLIFDGKKNKATYEKDYCPRDIKDIKNIKSWTREELEKEYIKLMKLCNDPKMS